MTTTVYSYGLKPSFRLKYKNGVYQLHEAVKLCCELFVANLDEDTDEFSIPDFPDIQIGDLDLFLKLLHRNEPLLKGKPVEISFEDWHKQLHLAVYFGTQRLQVYILGLYKQKTFTLDELKESSEHIEANDACQELKPILGDKLLEWLFTHPKKETDAFLKDLPPKMKNYISQALLFSWKKDADYETIKKFSKAEKTNSAVDIQYMQWKLLFGRHYKFNSTLQLWEANEVKNLDSAGTSRPSYGGFDSGFGGGFGGGFDTFVDDRTQNQSSSALFGSFVDNGGFAFGTMENHKDS